MREVHTPIADRRRDIFLPAKMAVKKKLPRARLIASEVIWQILSNYGKAHLL